MKSLFAQCTLAAVVAAGVSASLSVSTSMAQDARPGIGAQIEALGLDRAEVKSKLEGLSRDERITYLQTLGVRLPDGVARLDTASATASLKAVPLNAVNGATTVTALPADGKFTIMPWTGAIDPAITPGNVTVTPLPAVPDGKFNILPWTGPIDGTGVTVRPGSVSNVGTMVIDPAAVSGLASTSPSLPAK